MQFQSRKMSILATICMQLHIQYILLHIVDLLNTSRKYLNKHPLPLNLLSSDW